MDKLGKTAETMGIWLGISCVDSLVMSVDILIYQGFWVILPVGKKYFQTIFHWILRVRLELGLEPVLDVMPILRQIFALKQLAQSRPRPIPVAA